MSPLYALLLIPAIVVTIDLKPYDQIVSTFFDEVDKDNDGIADVLEIDCCFRVLDTNNDTKLDANEFRTYIDSKYTQLSGYDGILYKFFDTNGDDTLDVKDMHSVFKVADTNKDGVITRPKFVTHYSIALEELEKAIR